MLVGNNKNKVVLEKQLDKRIYTLTDRPRRCNILGSGQYQAISGQLI